MEFQALILISVATLGFISLCSSIINLVKWVYIMFLRPPKNLKRSYGSWALITGSTDGIGKAIAMELASEGLNLVLVGRDSLKLESTSSEIRHRIGDRVSIRTIVIDFAKVGGEEIEKRIGEEIEGLDVGVLINNAGLAYPFARFFMKLIWVWLRRRVRRGIDLLFGVFSSSEKSPPRRGHLLGQGG
ncbi:hypothetical protein HYC85_021174 [Camellia sinensis]|uniref:Uncharacterized protein n=1 Tax=Camellia sinensis TaxID=4442 RepID=A0A7J7GHN8_CAMSI|nr:hypothetical protein HYC85_021174 [Camellia sinensis]